MKVFLSSTAQDLDAYRKVADDTILRLAQQTVAMERFGPLPGTPVEECERLARASDVIICIVAHRYGFVPERGKGSITRREVEAAKNAGKDVLVWLVDDSFPWTAKKEQDLLADPNVIDDPARVEEVREGVAGLMDFKAWLRKTFTPETFTTQDDLGRKIAITLGTYVRGHAATSLPQERISISRLPTSGAELFGREAELQLLDDAWANPNTNIVSFVAWGGVGKTALANHWLKKRMARDNYRGAERVYGWSFFSQGTTERAASADLFIDQALRWFGDTDPTVGSPWDKGERLAGYLRQTRTLLVLDGLEPLQYPPGQQEGKLKDAAMQALLVELAAQQPGLCVISTRERIGDLIEFEDGMVIQHDLDKLSELAGAQILRSLNVKGDDDELEKASEEFGGHAFSLTLLGSYLDEVLDGDIRRRKEIENLFADTRYGEKAQAMMAAYEKWLGEGMELSILRLMGFFDRPADAASIEGLREPPVIAPLTQSLQHFKAREWSQAIAKLRRIKLLAEASPSEPGTLDAHPLLREYFKQLLREEMPTAWREGNSRIYEYLKNTTKQFPDTLEEMSPLFAAVIHGCAAGRYQEAFADIFVLRIQRGDPPFSLHRLGAFEANLTMLASFFEEPWQVIRPELQDLQAFLLNAVGHCLRTVGRLRESIEPLLTALEMDTHQSMWKSASQVATNIAELYITIGDLLQAKEFAQQSIEFADQSDDRFMQAYNRTTLGEVFYLSGQPTKSDEVFLQAEAIQKEDREHPLLYSLPGFRLDQLWLSAGETQRVKDRASRTVQAALFHKSLLAIGLDNLSQAQALIVEAQRGDRDLSEAANYLTTAISTLRQAGTMEFLVCGLLVHAQFHRLLGSHKSSERVLAEVHRIAKRSGMGLHLADYHLESARLRLAQGNKEKAHEHWTTAKKMINDMGYHRHDKEVEEIETQLAN